MRNDNDRGAEQRGNGVEIGPQDVGDLAEQEVADNPAADAGDRSKDGGLDWSEVVVKRCAGPGDAEQAESKGIKERQRVVRAVKDGAGDEAHDAGECDDKGENDDPKEVESCADTCQPAAQPEQERAREVEDEDQPGASHPDRRRSRLVGRGPKSIGPQRCRNPARRSRSARPGVTPGTVTAMAKVMISLPDELLARVDAQAAASGSTRSATIRDLAEVGLGERQRRLAGRMISLEGAARGHGGNSVQELKSGRPR